MQRDHRLMKKPLLEAVKLDATAAAPKGADTLYFRDPNKDRAARLRKERRSSRPDANKE